MFVTDDGREVAVPGWPPLYRFPVTEPQEGACGNGHVGKVDTTCTEDGCGKLIVNTH